MELTESQESEMREGAIKKGYTDVYDRFDSWEKDQCFNCDNFRSRPDRYGGKTYGYFFSCIKKVDIFFLVLRFNDNCDKFKLKDGVDNE